MTYLPPTEKRLVFDRKLKETAESVLARHFDGCQCKECTVARAWLDAATYPSF